MKLGLALLLFSGAALAQTTTQGSITTSQGTGLSSLPIRAAYDVNSLVPGDLMRKEWNGFATQFGSLASDAYRVPVNTFGSDIFPDGVQINPSNLGSGRIGMHVSAPPGSTSLTFSVPFTWDSTHATTPFGIAITSQNFSSVLSSSSCTPSAGVQACTTTATGLTSGTMYGVVIATDGTYSSTAGAEALLGRPTVVPVAPTLTSGSISGVAGLCSGFEHFSVWHSELWYDTRTDTAQDGTPNESPFSEIVLNTSATCLTVQSEATSGFGTSSFGFGVLVDDIPYANWVPPNNNFVDDFVSFSLPPGRHKVRIISGYQTQSAGSFDSHAGVMLKGVFAPQGSDTALVLPPSAPQRSLVLYGDSVISGNLAPTLPSLNGIPGLLRSRYYGSTIHESWGSRQLFEDIGGATGAANLAKLVSYFSAARPTDIWLAMGINDWGNTTYTAANFGSAEGALMDALHAAMPNTRIWLQSLLISKEEAATNGNGETIPNFRTQQLAACNARSWCNYVNGATALLSASDITGSDSIHILGTSQRAYVDALLGILETGTIVAPLNPNLVALPQYGRCQVWQSSDTVFTCAGQAIPTLLSGTAGTADTTDINFNLLKFTTSGAANNAVAPSGPFTMATMNQTPSLCALVRTDPAAVTSTRIYIGLGASSLDQVATLAGANGIRGCWWRYDTGLSDTAWTPQSSDGTTASVSASLGAVVAAATTYQLCVDLGVGGQCVFRQNGVVITSKVTNIPSGTTELGEEASITGLAASARSLSVGELVLQRKGIHP